MTISNAGSVFINEEGLNRLIKQMMKQRPSMFNFGTERINRKTDLLCFQPTVDIDLPPDQPWITCIQPLVFENFKLDFCYQIKDFEFDLFPSNSAPTNIDQFLINITLFIGIGLPDLALVDPFIRKKLNQEKIIEDPTTGEKIIELIEVDRLECFQLNAQITGHFKIEDLIVKEGEKATAKFMVPKVDAVDIIKIEPEVISKTAELYIYFAISTSRTKIESIIENIPIIRGIKLIPVLDPKIINNELQIFWDAEVIK